jgi:hypothetical protein
MKIFFKTTAFLLLTVVLFQSCTSDEGNEDLISEEQGISVELSGKIKTTASYVNDYNFFVNNVVKSNCEFLPITHGYFNTPEGDYFEFTLSSIESLDMWLTEYEKAKTNASNTTGVEFSNEDLIIEYINKPSGWGGILTRESMLYYFENCDIYGFGDDADYSIPFNDISINCDSNASIHFWLLNDNGTVDSFDGVGLNSLGSLLTDYNLQNNTNYTTDNIRIGSVTYTPNNEEVWIAETYKLINYFENCMLSRDASVNDCLNFVYPLQINRANQEITIENDEDLATTFEANVNELSFVFPINLLGGNGTIVTIETNETLENALDNSSTYCN